MIGYSTLNSLFIIIKWNFNMDPCAKKKKPQKPTKHSDEKSILNELNWIDTCAAFVMQGGRHV